MKQNKAGDRKNMVSIKIELDFDIEKLADNDDENIKLVKEEIKSIGESYISILSIRMVEEGGFPADEVIYQKTELFTCSNCGKHSMDLSYGPNHSGICPECLIKEKS